MNWGDPLDENLAKWYLAGPVNEILTQNEDAKYQQILDVKAFGYFQQAIESWRQLSTGLKTEILRYLNQASRYFFHWLYDAGVLNEDGYNEEIESLMKNAGKVINAL